MFYCRWKLFHAWIMNLLHLHVLTDAEHVHMWPISKYSQQTISRNNNKQTNFELISEQTHRVLFWFAVIFIGAYLFLNIAQWKFNDKKSTEIDRSDNVISNTINNLQFVHTLWNNLQNAANTTNREKKLHFFIAPA